MQITLFVWPKYWGQYEMGVDLYDEASDIWEQILIDKDLSVIANDDYTDEFVAYLQELINENADEIHNMISLVSKELDIPIT